MDKIEMGLETLQDVLYYFVKDDIVIDILQIIVEVGLENKSKDEIIEYLENEFFEE